MNLQRLRHEILDFVTALFMGNLSFGGHSTVYYRPEDCYTGPFTLCKAVHSPLHCLRCVCVLNIPSVCVCGGERDYFCEKVTSEQVSDHVLDCSQPLFYFESFRHLFWC